MTRKETITNLLAQADALRHGGCLPEASEDLAALEAAADWLRNDRQGDRGAMAEKLFGLSVVMAIITGIGLLLGIGSAFFGRGGSVALCIMSVAAYLIAATLMAVAIWLVD